MNAPKKRLRLISCAIRRCINRHRPVICRP